MVDPCDRLSSHVAPEAAETPEGAPAIGARVRESRKGSWDASRSRIPGSSPSLRRGVRSESSADHEGEGHARVGEWARAGESARSGCGTGAPDAQIDLVEEEPKARAGSRRSRPKISDPGRSVGRGRGTCEREIERAKDEFWELATSFWYVM